MPTMTVFPIYCDEWDEMIKLAKVRSLVSLAVIS